MTIQSKPTDACSQCGFIHNCICHLQPEIHNTFQLAILSHPKELNKETNTGKLLEHSLSHCQAYTWSRVEPVEELIQAAQDPNIRTWLLFPHPEATSSLEFQKQTEQECIQPQQNLFIIIDSTWQEAKKMLRKTLWLQNLPCLSLDLTHTSEYQLRRNQQTGSLCTCEVGIELLKLMKMPESAQQLHHYFTAFNTVFQADKSGHTYQREVNNGSKK
ncbi:tRNA-uridine aminocarboxypropyltransferase [Aliivibrio kagoshimensis]|uniref:tRNA-uridine aminocarboxypropyltransferase n=1 Tax=Aliivibrio kagoshimensis TaxID=2910230 RepID=UPI003D0C48F5